MKIAFLNIYSGINNRGAESFSHELAKKLGKNHQVDFFSGKDCNVKIVQPQHNRGLLKTFFLDAATISVLRFTLKILPKLGSYDWLIPMNGFWQVLLCKFSPGKILITGHSGPGWDERWNLYLKPDIFVATTQPTADWAKKTCFYTKVIIIPYGIDEYKNITPVNVNLEKPVVLCPAAAVRYKRVDLAIKAVSKMKRGSLLHLGTGPLLPDLKKLGEELLGKRFLSLTVNYDQMPGFYAACDVVTLPSSEQENSPMVFLEAMAANKITITTDTPRSRWILGNAGIFIDPTNIVNYSKALISGLGSDKKLIKDQVVKYSWDKIIRKYDECFCNNSSL